jgi:hypothetical protein
VESGDGWRRTCAASLLREAAAALLVQASPSLFGVGRSARDRHGAAGATTPARAVFARRPLGERGRCSRTCARTSLEFVALSRIAFTDMLLLVWLSLCVAALHRAFEAPRRGTSGTGWFALACVASGLAILTKGAIGVLFPGAVALVHLLLWGRVREMLRPGWIALALPLVLGIGFSWYLLLGFTHPDGFAFGATCSWSTTWAASPRRCRATRARRSTTAGDRVGFLPWSPFRTRAARAGLRGRDERERFAPVRAALRRGAGVLLRSRRPSSRTTRRPRCRAWRSWSATGSRARPKASRAQPGLDAAGALACVAMFALASRSRRCSRRCCRARERARAERLGWRSRSGSRRSSPRSCWPARSRSRCHVPRAARGACSPRSQSASCTYTIVFQALLPVDARFGEPLRRLAVRAAGVVPADERIVMLGLRRRPSVCFYADRETTSAGRGSGLSPESTLFRGDVGRVGITRGRSSLPAAVEAGDGSRASRRSALGARATPDEAQRGEPERPSPRTPQVGSGNSPRAPAAHAVPAQHRVQQSGAVGVDFDAHERVVSGRPIARGVARAPRAAAPRAEMK